MSNWFLAPSQPGGSYQGEEKEEKDKKEEKEEEEERILSWLIHQNALNAYIPFHAMPNRRPKQRRGRRFMVIVNVKRDDWETRPSNSAVRISYTCFFFPTLDNAASRASGGWNDSNVAWTNPG